MKIEISEIPPEGIAIGRLSAKYPHLKEEILLAQLVELCKEKKAHLRGSRLFPGQARRRGRPVVDKKRVQITLRLPAELVTWLRSKSNYTQLIENLIEPEYKKACQKQSELDVFNLFDKEKAPEYKKSKCLTAKTLRSKL